MEAVGVVVVHARAHTHTQTRTHARMPLLLLHSQIDPPRTRSAPRSKRCAQISGVVLPTTFAL